ncbi:hypothetical protein BJ170DRAFT_484806 [Xylariales sp. AK1849]|nr:hypothetical protein BJ170DRAFT_484806 [Xylariales sp. AK1849]
MSSCGELVENEEQNEPTSLNRHTRNNPPRSPQTPKMYLLITLSLLFLQFAAFCSATPLLSTRIAGSACTYLTSTSTAPSCPGGCCGWQLSTDSPGPWCDADSASTVTLASKPANWLASCTSLQQSVSSNKANYILTTYQQNIYHAVVSNSGCAFQVSISTPIDPDSIHIGSADIATFLTSGIAASQNGNFGATGSTRCWSYSLQWKMIPPGN